LLPALALPEYYVTTNRPARKNDKVILRPNKSTNSPKEPAADIEQTQQRGKTGSHSGNGGKLGLSSSL